MILSVVFFSQTSSVCSGYSILKISYLYRYETVIKSYISLHFHDVFYFL